MQSDDNFYSDKTQNSKRIKSHGNSCRKKPSESLRLTDYLQAIILSQYKAFWKSSSGRELITNIYNIDSDTITFLLGKAGLDKETVDNFSTMEAGDDPYRELSNSVKSKYLYSIEKTIYQYIKQCTGAYSRKTRYLLTRIHSLAEKLNLDSIDQNILIFTILKDTNELCFNWYCEDLSQRRIFSTWFKNNLADWEKRLSPSSRLHRLGLLVISLHGVDWSPSCSDLLLEYIFNNRFNLKQGLCYKNKDKSLPLSRFQLSNNQQLIMRSLLSSQRIKSIYFYGTAGTGKTSLALALANSCGKNPWFLKVNDQRIKFWQLAKKILDPKKDILIIDEADKLLSYFENSFFISSNDKGENNALIENLKVPTIFISNNASHIPDSTLRRFDYSYNFPELEREQKLLIWSNLIREKRLQSYKKYIDLPTFVDSWQVPPAIIDRSLSLLQESGLPLTTGRSSASKQKKTEFEHTLKRRVNEIITEGLSSFEKVTRDKNIKKVTPENKKSNYDPSLLNTGLDMKKVERSLISYQNFYNDLLIEENKEKGFKMLFHGLPGTGKTQWAKYIGQKYRLKIMIKRASDILSPYVGVAEKNLAELFASAQKKDTLLLIDEADTFMYSRSGSNRTWENSLVNEFLTQLESFSGMLICTTNLIATLDQAVTRRFGWKIEFKLPCRQKLIKAIRAYFNSPSFRLSTSQIQKLSSTHNNLSFGDLVSIHSQWEYFSKEDQNFKELLSLFNETKIQETMAVGF